MQLAPLQRFQPFTTGSFLEVQFLRFADPSAVIHDSPHRAHSGPPDSLHKGDIQAEII